MKITTSLVLAVLYLVCVGPFAKVEAVSPPPDGDYPGGNTAEGRDALFSLTTGSYNTALGWNSLASDREGKFNAAVGAGTLVFNVADNNTAIGNNALQNNTTGKETRLSERSPSLATRTAISTRLLAMARFRITPLAI